MTTDVNIMEEMLDRATNPSRENMDELGVQMFCMVAKSNIQKAQEMIVSKVRSRNETEAIRAIALLEECMVKCGSEFQDQIGKFRFLNYLIRMVSKKYEGAETPQAIKQRIMECLLLWTTAYPQKEKIREAYDNLNKEGGVEHGNTMVSAATVTATAKKDSILGEDEATLKRLLQSNDQEDYKRANLLIQYRVNQEARRTEFRAQQKSELQEVENIANLLNQMLDTHESDGSKDMDGSDTINLIRELYISCKKHKPILQRLIEMNESSDEDLMGETLETNDALVAVMKRYKNTIVYHSNKQHSSTLSNPTSTGNSNSSTTSDLLTALLEDIPITTPMCTNTTTTTTTPSTTTHNIGNSTLKTLEELNEIFGNVRNDEITDVTPSIPHSIFSSQAVLEPTIAVEVSTKSTTHNDETMQMEKQRPLREMLEITELNAELFKNSMPPSSSRLGSFKKDPEKLTLNDLVKEKSNTTVTYATIPSVKTNILDDTVKMEQLEVGPAIKNESDDMMLTGAASEEDNIQSAASALKPAETSAAMPNLLTHLSDISIDLDDILATADERNILDDDDIRVTLNFAENRPSKNVSVIVISIENKSKMPIKDFQFEASVKKPNKVRLLPPSETSMPPFKRFRPPTPINQIMLLLNPTRQPVDITCIVGYRIGDDPDPIKESIAVKDIPFVE